MTCGRQASFQIPARRYSDLRPMAGPLDWGHVVDAAAARLEESWVRPDSTGHMLASGLAEELAATLCAYGMVAAEVDHMHDHEDALTVGSRWAPRRTVHITPMGCRSACRGGRDLMSGRPGERWRGDALCSER